MSVVLTTLKPFENFNKNTCTNCGKKQAAFATSLDAMRSGKGHCAPCAKVLYPLEAAQDPPDEPPQDEFTFISSKTIKALKDAGYESLLDVGMADDDILLAISGIGPKALKNIKKELDAIPSET